MRRQISLAIASQLAAMLLLTPALVADGNLPPVGNTVDVDNAVWYNTIGASELITFWEDPDFDPAQSAFYYAGVYGFSRWVVTAVMEKILRMQ